MSIFKKQNISTDYVDSTTGTRTAGSATGSDLGTLLGVTESESELVLQTGGSKHSIARTRKTILPSVLETENLRQMLTVLEQGAERLFEGAGESMSESMGGSADRSAEQKGGTDKGTEQLISEIDALVKVLQ